LGKKHNFAKTDTKCIICNLNLHKPSIWEALLTVKMDYMIPLNAAVLKHKTFIYYTAKYQRTIQTKRPPIVGEVSANFSDRECHVVSVTDPYGSIFGFLDWSRFFFFQLAS
jgi:hypothetical protein